MNERNDSPAKYDRCRVATVLCKRCCKATRNKDIIVYDFGRIPEMCVALNLPAKLIGVVFLQSSGMSVKLPPVEIRCLYSVYCVERDTK